MSNQNQDIVNPHLSSNVIFKPTLDALNEGDFHSKISSLEIIGGAKVILFDDQVFGGTSLTFTENQSDLSDKSFNNDAGSLKVVLPYPIFGSDSLDFGNLYVESYDGASEYNEDQAKTFTLKNGAESDTTLHWEITDADATLNFSASSGAVAGESTVTIEVWADPTSSGADSGSFTIATSYGDYLLPNINRYDPGIDKSKDYGNRTITWELTAYDTPSAPSQVVPALGSNGRVNMASGESLQFEVESGDPSYPSAELKGYQWQTQREGIAFDSSAWEPTSGNGSAQMQISLTDTGEWTVYARMVDDNKVATKPIAIPVTVWAQPVVSTAPPSISSADWFTTYTTYAGVVNQPMTLQATSDLEPTFSASGLTQKSQVGSGAGDFDGSTLVSIDNRPAINDSFTDKTVALWFKTDDLN